MVFRVNQTSTDFRVTVSQVVAHPLASIQPSSSFQVTKSNSVITTNKQWLTSSFDHHPSLSFHLCSLRIACQPSSQLSCQPTLKPSGHLSSLQPSTGTSFQPSSQLSQRVSPLRPIYDFSFSRLLRMEPMKLLPENWIRSGRPFPQSKWSPVLNSIPIISQARSQFPSSFFWPALRPLPQASARWPRLTPLVPLTSVTSSSPRPLTLGPRPLPQAPAC